MVHIADELPEVDFGLQPVTGCMLDELMLSNGALLIVRLDYWNDLSPAQQDVLTQAAIDLEIWGTESWMDTVQMVKDDLVSYGVEITHFSPEESKEFYRIYRDAIWEYNLANFGDYAQTLYDLITDPNCPRLQ